MLLKNDRLLRALSRQSVDCTPIWIMRQAGRYLPEYRALRKYHGSFIKMCKTPEVACEITLQPLQRFDLDAAIIFSDILTIPDAMGLELELIEHVGPVFKKPVRTAREIANLSIPSPNDELSYVMDAIRLTKQELAGKVPLIGFAGSPWTMAAYMVEGRSVKEFPTIRQMLYQAPELLTQLLEKMTQAVIDYLNAQIDAGVDVVMLFDTWGGLLTTEMYQKFSLGYMENIIKKLKRKRADQLQFIPIILFTKSGGQWLEQMANTGCDALGLDWTIDIQMARQRVGNDITLQGNLDPAVLLASPEVVVQETQKILQQLSSDTSHIFNLGHGITPDVPYENVKVLVDTVHSFPVK